MVLALEIPLDLWAALGVARIPLDLLVVLDVARILLDQSVALGLAGATVLGCFADISF